MKSSDESLSDSEKVKFKAMYEMFKKQPGFAEMMSATLSGKSESSSKQTKSESARTEPTVTVAERPTASLKAGGFIEEISQDDDYELSIKNDFIIEERSRSYAAALKFYEASSLLQDLENLDENDLGIKLLLAECYIQLGRENKAERSLRDVEKILMKHPMCDVDEVIALADDCTEGSKNVRALLLLRIAGDMFLSNSSLTADDKLGGLFRCARKMHEPIEKMLNPEASSKTEGLEGLLKSLLQPLKAITEGGGQVPEIDASKLQGKEKKKVCVSGRERVIAFDYGVSIMEEMLEKLRMLSGGDPENKALKQAILANTINSHYSSTNQHARSIKLLDVGIKYFENHFGRTANQYRIYSTMLNNKGVELHNCEKYKEAEIAKLAALEAKEYASDYNSEEERRADLQVVRDSLRITRMHLKLA